MRLQASELEKYLGNNDDKLNEICSEKTIQKLNRYKRGDVKESASLIDYLLTQHHENGLSLRQLAKNVGVTATTIIRIFHTYELPTLTHAEAVRAMLYDRWQDPKFRKRNAEAVRQTEKTPVRGHRRDINLNADSMMEANLARIFLYCGRIFSHKIIVTLKVDKNHRELFDSDETNITFDFAVQNQTGKLRIYEVASNFYTNESQIAKLEMALQQHPSVDFRFISPDKYKRLERYFKTKIENSPHFSGWETTKSNLKKNPERYGHIGNSSA